MPTLFRLPKPSLLMASVFHSGKGGSKAMSPALRQPRGTVTMTAAPLNSSPSQKVQAVAVQGLHNTGGSKAMSPALRQPRATVTMTVAPSNSSPVNANKNNGDETTSGCRFECWTASNPAFHLQHMELRWCRNGTTEHATG